MKWIGIIWVIITFIFSGYILWDHTHFSSKKFATKKNDQHVNQRPSIFNAGKALLATRFDNLDTFKKKVNIRYDQTYTLLNDTIDHVYLTYITNYGTARSHLSSGITQSDLRKIQRGNLSDKIFFLLNYPFCTSHRYLFYQAFHLARRLEYVHGEGDVAFFDLALQTYNRILDKKSACKVARDSSEKGYINTFNHVTAQALITSLFSEQTADMLSVLHERNAMIELTNGRFTEEQLTDPDNNPIDNYVDIVNNEWGQEIGILLRNKYQIDPNTVWSAKLLSDYLNDLCAYYCWSFSIRIQPFDEQDPLMIQYANKLNRIMKLDIPL